MKPPVPHSAFDNMLFYLQHAHSLPALPSNGSTHPRRGALHSVCHVRALNLRALRLQEDKENNADDRAQQPETKLPKEIAAILELQTPGGQWRLCKRLYRALGQTPVSIPSPPEGVKDGRWATALAVTFLRRSPDFIDLTYNAYSRAIAWVDEPLLAQAHKRLPPADLYYPVDDEASRQGRWQQQAEEALEECGYAYFLPPSDDGVGGDVGGNAVDTDGSGVAHTEQGGQEDKTFPLSTNLGLVVGEKKPGGGQRRPATSKAASRRADLKSRREAAAAEVAERGILEKQSHGLHLEVARATRAASTTFKDGDRVESRWRRPTRLDKPRLDPYAWHTGRVVQSHKDGARVDVVFEDGDGERLSGIPAKYVRLAPLASDLRQPVIGLGAGDGDIATAGSTSLDSPSCPLTAMPIESLCPASRRELAHIASANTSLRRTWEDPVPIGEELARLRMLGEEKRRARPEWQGSFPLLNFQAAKRLSLGAGRAGTAARKAAAAAAAGGRDRRRERRQAQKPHRGGAKARTRKPSAAASLPAKLGIVAAIAEREDEGYRQAHPDFTHALMTGDDTTTTRRGSSSSSPPLSPSSSPALVETQAKLVAAAVAYDRCVVGVRDCLDRGAAAFRVARTYSEQQKAFEESTAALGPALPARAGYTDWRGSAVVGLQNATLDVVEAMDSWAAEWAAARESKIRAEEGGLGRDRGGEGNGAIEGGKEVEKDGVVAAAPVTAPPFLWEGSPLVSTIIGHSAKLLAGAPELKEWYGPGFPMERNPFFLAYPIDDRPVTPRNALVRAWVDGEMVTTVSRMLLEEREKEEAALKCVVDKQGSAPSWWPTSRGAMGGESHYERIRRAEKVLAREESQVVQGRGFALKIQVAAAAT